MEEEITAMFDNLRKETVDSIKLDTETLIKLHREDRNDDKHKRMGNDTTVE
jgi:hypothetical protein